MILSELRQQWAPRKERGPPAGYRSVHHGTGHGIQEGQPGRRGFLRHILAISVREPFKIQTEREREPGKNSRQVIELDCVAVDRQRSGNDRFSRHNRPIEQDLIQKLHGLYPEDITTRPLGLPMDQRRPGIGRIGKNENHEG